MWGDNNSRTEYRDDAGLTGANGALSGFFQTSNPINYPTGAGSWWHLLDIRHSNLDNNYAMQFAGSFFDQNLYFRKTNNNASQAWSLVLTQNTSGYLNVGSINTMTTAGQSFFTGHQAGGGYAYPTGIFRAITDNPNGASNFFFDGVTNGTTNFFVRADGMGYFANSLAIGTSDPQSYKLAVKGAVHAQSVQIDMTGWADYVFKPVYHLKSLSYLKSYIAQNHHLPDMPSESDVKNKGIDLGEIVKLQTKKIEELTLYLIEKDKQIERQEATNKKQQQAIDELTQKLDLLINSLKTK